jgi:hypothetical protein
MGAGAHPEDIHHHQVGYNTNVFDLEPVLIQPAYIQCAEPSDQKIVRALMVLCNM